MKRIIAFVGVFLSVALASPVSAKAPIRDALTASSFIIWCDCDTPDKRASMIEKIGRAGGRVFYAYEQMGGLAVTVPATRNAAAVERRLRRIPGVFGVHPDRAVQLYKPSGPQ